MKASRALVVSVGVVVGMLVLPAASSAGGWRLNWGPFPSEGPAWWEGCGWEVGQQTPSPQTLCEPHVVGQSFHVNLEATEISSHALALVGYVQPIAGARATYWELAITEPYCEYVFQTGEQFFSDCNELDQTPATRVASGEIVGGSPEELVRVSGSTAVAPEGTVELDLANQDGPVELLPDRGYGATLIENAGSAEASGRGEIELITAPKVAPSPARTGESAKKYARREKTRKHQEERRVKAEEDRQRNGKHRKTR